MESFRIIAHTQDASQIEAVKAIMKALKIKFEITKEKPYNSEFVQKIVSGDEDYKSGKGRKVTIEELNSLWK